MKVIPSPSHQHHRQHEPTVPEMQKLSDARAELAAAVTRAKNAEAAAASNFNSQSRRVEKLTQVSDMEYKINPQRFTFMLAKAMELEQPAPQYQLISALSPSHHLDEENIMMRQTCTHPKHLPAHLSTKRQLALLPQCRSWPTCAMN